MNESGILTMRRIRWIHSAMTSIALSTALACSVQAEDKAQLAWLTDLPRAYQMMQTQKRPMLLFVSIDGCYYCSKMTATTFAETGIAHAVAQDFIPVKVNGSKRPELIRILKVKAYPTTFIIAPNLEILAQIKGYANSTQLHDALTLAKKNDRTARRGAAAARSR